MAAASAIRGLLAVVVLSAACTTSTPIVSHTVYQYALAATAEELHPGQTLPLSWRATPTLVRGDAAPSNGWLCAAIAGPYPSVDVLKSSNVEARTCPITVAGMVLATEAAEADLVLGKHVTQDLTLPASLAPGYYQLLSLATYATGNSGGSTFTSRIFRIVPQP